MLALVCITRSENFAKKSLINYNISCLKKALAALMPPPPQQLENGNENGQEAENGPVQIQDEEE
jgi:hypothetical protein